MTELPLVDVCIPPSHSATRSIRRLGTTAALGINGDNACDDHLSNSGYNETLSRRDRQSREGDFLGDELLAVS